MTVVAVVLALFAVGLVFARVVGKSKDVTVVHRDLGAACGEAVLAVVRTSSAGPTRAQAAVIRREVTRVADRRAAVRRVEAVPRAAGAEAVAAAAAVAGHRRREVSGMTSVHIGRGARSADMVSPEKRDRLRQRQSEVLADLLSARVPNGFDGPGVTVASRILAVKRAESAVRACPVLTELPTWPRGFLDYAAGHAKSDCSAHDARSYIAWLREYGNMHERRWVATETVRSGARRWIFADGRLVFRLAGRTIGA